MGSKLWIKLALAFVFVALVGVVLVAIFANRATSKGFQRFLQASDLTSLQEVQEALQSYYAGQESWSGANSVLRQSGLGPQVGEGGYFLRVLDRNGELVAARGGQSRPLTDFDIVLPLIVENEQVGVLAAMAAGGGSRAAAQYLASVNQAIVLAGLVAVVAALILGILLARWLTRPLQQMTEAAQAVAAGNLRQQVPVRSKDELGQLARDFNHMARALETAEGQRRQMLADTAHDLRTPISIMRSHLEAMLDGVFPATPENLAIVHEETLHLSRLVDDLRTLSLVQTGHLPLNLQLVDVTALVEQTAASFLPLADADGVRMTSDLRPTQPLLADAARLHQVLANLLVNALRYAPLGNAAPTVVLTVRDRAPGVKIEVSDSGPGLSPEQQEHVFDRFWRSGSARSRADGGSGLGLSIAQGIVQAHGGTILVSSQPGAGTTFSIELPGGREIL